jgi:hypothetical protein
MPQPPSLGPHGSVKIAQPTLDELTRLGALTSTNLVQPTKCGSTHPLRPTWPAHSTQPTCSGTSAKLTRCSAVGFSPLGSAYSLQHTRPGPIRMANSPWLTSDWPLPLCHLGSVPLDRPLPLGHLGPVPSDRPLPLGHLGPVPSDRPLPLGHLGSAPLDRLLLLDHLGSVPLDRLLPLDHLGADSQDPSRSLSYHWLSFAWPT